MPFDAGAGPPPASGPSPRPSSSPLPLPGRCRRRWRWPLLSLGVVMVAVCGRSGPVTVPVPPLYLARFPRAAAPAVWTPSPPVEPPAWREGHPS